MKTKKNLLSIALTLFFIFVSYNVIMGLMLATALQGFSGLVLIIVAMFALVIFIFDNN